jgi:hypothetical protein
LKSTAVDLFLWELRIKERTKSGMSVSEWCKINEISKHKYHYWNYKISKSQKLNIKMDFAEVASIISNAHESKSNSGKSEDFQIFFKNLHVTVPSNFNEDSLAGLMKVLRIFTPGRKLC